MLLFQRVACGPYKPESMTVQLLDDYALCLGI